MQLPRPDSLEVRRAHQRARVRLLDQDQGPPRVGPYEVLSLLGTGGFSTVWVARDVRLQRMVALKRLAATRDDRVGRRIMREAQMLAQLAHPNIVEVFDVLQHEGMVFVAMELVRGPSLAEWLTGPRTQAEIDAAFAASAAALQAVHAAGLAHGDFKPHNVMVGAGPTPKLLDFGLSAAAGELPSLRGGTPGYMAPEQVDTGMPTPAADQYALCVAWLQALGQPSTPGGGRSKGVASLAGAGHALQVLWRGAAADPADRWPSVAALLSAMSPSSPGRRAVRRLSTRGGVAATLGVFAAIGALSFVWTRDDAVACRGLDEARVVVDPASRLVGLASADPAHGAQVTAQLAEATQTWSQQWHEARTTVCRVRPAHTATTLACLGIQQQWVQARLLALGGAPAQTRASAATLVASMPSPAQCTGAEPSPLPDVDTVVLGDLYARLYGLSWDQYGTAVAVTEAQWRALIDDAKAAGVGSIEAEARLELAQKLHAQRRVPEAIALAESAYQIPLAPADAPLRAMAAVLIATYYAYDFDRQGAYRWARVADALQDPSGPPGNGSAMMQMALAMLEANDGNLEEGARHFEVALRHARGARTPIPQLESALLTNFSELRLRQDQPRAALDLAEQGLARFEGAVAEGAAAKDPLLVLYLAKVGKAAIAVDALMRAQTVLSRARTLAKAPPGHEHPYAAEADLITAQLLLRQQRSAEAEPYARAALAFSVQQYGTDDLRTAEAQAVVGEVGLALRGADPTVR